jgi:aquaporin Z
VKASPQASHPTEELTCASRPCCTSVNPARSTGVAFFNGDGAPAQLWVFWIAPRVGAAIAGIAYPLLFGRNDELADRPVRDDALDGAATA